MNNHIEITGKIVLITGANRGIGRALVDEALKRGAKQVYAATRTPFSHPDPRVKSLIFDITNQEQIREAAKNVEALDILINNVGVSSYDDLSDRTVIEQHLAVNLFGTFDVTQAFLPLLLRSKGAVVNNLSLLAVAPLLPIASYSISKAAALSMTQSLRTALAAQGVTVHAALTGPVDTDMSRGLDIPKASAESVANGIFNGIENVEEDIFPDPMSASIADGWNNGVSKAMERQNAALVAGQQ
ncbi:MAG: SDR family NAD(P)-dependent oxidoreductase [Mucilaginibacter sp.]